MKGLQLNKTFQNIFFCCFLFITCIFSYYLFRIWISPKLNQLEKISNVRITLETLEILLAVIVSYLMVSFFIYCFVFLIKQKKPKKILLHYLVGLIVSLIFGIGSLFFTFSINYFVFVSAYMLKLMLICITVTGVMAEFNKKIF